MEAVFGIRDYGLGFRVERLRLRSYRFGVRVWNSRCQVPN